MKSLHFDIFVKSERGSGNRHPIKYAAVDIGGEASFMTIPLSLYNYIRPTYQVASPNAWSTEGWQICPRLLRPHPENLKSIFTCSVVTVFAPAAPVSGSGIAPAPLVPSTPPRR